MAATGSAAEPARAEDGRFTGAFALVFWPVEAGIMGATLAFAADGGAVGAPGVGWRVSEPHALAKTKTRPNQHFVIRVIATLHLL